MVFTNPTLLIIDPISISLVVLGVLSSAATAVVTTIGGITVKKLLKKDKVEITLTKEDGTNVKLSFSKDVSDAEIERAITMTLQKDED